MTSFQIQPSNIRSRNCEKVNVNTQFPHDTATQRWQAASLSSISGKMALNRRHLHGLILIDSQKYADRPGHHFKYRNKTPLN